MVRTRKVVAAMVSAGALAVLAGCSGADDPTGEPSTSATGGGGVCESSSPVTITFWHTYSTDSPENTQLTDVVLPAFEAACPGVKVEATVMPYDGLHDQLIAAV